MTFNVGIGSTLIASSTNDGIPYLWKSGDITTTPSNETKITASDGAAGDEFGYSVAVGSGRIVVGAWNDGTGSAYIFDLSGTQLAKITATGGAGSSPGFGWSVSIGSSRIVVGAPYDGSGFGNGDKGAAYIFDLSGTQLAKITASDGAGGDYFGNSVAVGSGRIVVGAWDNGGKGAAYIFDLSGTQLAKITASDAASGDRYGWSVAVGCGRILVSSPFDDDNVGSSGSVYVYDLDGNQIKKITTSDAAASDRIGYAEPGVAVGCGRIVIGAPDDDIGSNSNQGSVYVYDLNGNNELKITASDGAASDSFGQSVAVGSGRIVVGARDDDIGSNSDQGSAYIFDLDGNQLVKITASDGDVSDLFGKSVAVGCGRIVVSAYLDDVNGSGSGSAYIYETPQIYTLYDAIELQSV